MSACFLHCERQLKDTCFIDDVVARLSVISEIEDVGYVFLIVKLSRSKNQINVAVNVKMLVELEERVGRFLRRSPGPFP